MARENLPRRTPGVPQIPHRSGSAAFALLIRVATGLDEWAEFDRQTNRSLEDE